MFNLNENGVIIVDYIILARMVAIMLDSFLNFLKVVLMKKYFISMHVKHIYNLRKYHSTF